MTVTPVATEVITLGSGLLGEGTLGGGPGVEPSPEPVPEVVGFPAPVPDRESDLFVDTLLQQFEPWLTGDLITYLRALASMFAEVEQWAFPTREAGDEEWEDDGYTILVDPDRCPDKGLAWLAQFVGERLPPGIEGAMAREWIKDNPNNNRGTPRSIFLATQRRLTGDRLVTMIERPGVAVDEISVTTYTAQTPDPEGTRLDILDATPADVILEYQVVAGQLWDDVNTDNASWQEAKDTYPTWSDMATDMAGDASFGRPRPG